MKQLWNECLEQKNDEQKNDPDIKGRIIYVNMQMLKYKLLLGLCLCERILKITDNLSKTIQHKSMSASEAQVIAKQVDHVCENTHTDEPSLPRKIKMPKQFEYTSKPSI